MKKFLLLWLLFALSVSGFAQNLDTSNTLKKTDRELGLSYRKQSREQKTLGYILLGGGLGLSFLGASKWDLYASTGADAAIIVGAISFIASIPVFISAAKNKGRAEILLRNQGVPLTYKKYYAVPSVGISLSLSRKRVAATLP
jgi:hypothetical protein